MTHGSFVVMKRSFLGMPDRLTASPTAPSVPASLHGFHTLGSKKCVFSSIPYSAAVSICLYPASSAVDSQEDARASSFELGLVPTHDPIARSINSYRIISR